MSDKVKFFLVQNFNDDDDMFMYRAPNEKAAEEEARRVITKVKSSQFNYSVRSKLMSKSGAHHFILYPSKLFFVMTCDQTVKEARIYDLFEEVGKIVEETEVLSQLMKDRITEKVKELNVEDKLGKIASTCDDIIVDVGKNVRQITKNITKAEDLEQKSKNLEFISQTYKDDALALKRLAWWQNYKLILIIVLLVLTVGVICYFAFAQ